MPPVVVLPEDSLRSLPPSSFVLALCVWNGYAEVGNMIVCARAYYTDPYFLASEFGLARHVSKNLRTRLQHACGDLNHERGLARVQQFLSAPGVKNLTPAQLINVGDNETPLNRAVQCGNILLTSGFYTRMVQLLLMTTRLNAPLEMIAIVMILLSHLLS